MNITYNSQKDNYKDPKIIEDLKGLKEKVYKSIPFQEAIKCTEKCPVCGSTNIKSHSRSLFDNKSMINVKCKCHDCTSEWESDPFVYISTIDCDTSSIETKLNKAKTKYNIWMIIWVCACIIPIVVAEIFTFSTFQPNTSFDTKISYAMLVAVIMLCFSYFIHLLIKNSIDDFENNYLDLKKLNTYRNIYFYKKRIDSNKNMYTTVVLEELVDEYLNKDKPTIKVSVTK